MESHSHSLVPLGSAVTGEGIRLIACTRPFSTRRVEMEMKSGRYIGDMVEEAVGQQMLALCDAHVFVGDRLVPREWWWRVKPRPGQTVTVRVVPQGDGGGGKDPLRMVLSIAVMAATFYFTGPLASMIIEGGLSAGLTFGTMATFAGPLAAGLITPIGAMLINATELPQ